MQSFGQYNHVKVTVGAQVKVGKIVNWSTEKKNVLKTDTTTEGDSTTTYLSEKDKSQDLVIVGWDGSNHRLNPINWTISRRAFVFAILWINVYAAH